MKIGRKFALWVVSILLAFGAMAVYLFYTVELRAETAKLDMFGRLTGHVIEDSLISYMQRRDMPGLNKKLDDIKRSAEPISGIMLLNRDGVVRASTDKGLINRKFGIHDAGCRECHEKGSRGILEIGGSIYRWASPIENKPVCHACHLASVENNGLLVIDFSIAEFSKHMREELREGLIIFLSFMVAIGAVMVFLTKVLVTRRLDRIGATMRDFQQGVPLVPMSVEGHDEITQLETGFNAMAQAITSREQEKDALVRTVNAQVQFLQLLIDTIPMPVFYKDKNGVYLGYNKAFAEFLGLTKDRLIGKTVYDVAPKELADIYYQKDKELFDHPGVQVYEYSVKHADGTIHEVLFNKATYTDAEGRVAGLVGAMPDITERKRLEQKLARSESHLRAIIDAEPECVKLVAADGTLIEMNPAGLAMIEANSIDEVEGSLMSSLLVPEYQAAFEALTEKAFRGESGALEYEIVGLKGTRRWLEIHSAPLRNARGEIFALLGVARDITERKRIEMALRESEDKFRQVVTSATDAIMVFDAETRLFVEVNKAAEEIYGYSREEFLNMRQDDIPVEKKAAEAYIHEIISSEKPLNVPLRYHKRKDGTTFPVEISSSVFTANGRQLICGVIRDITERKKSEQVIQRNYDTQTAINWVLHISLEELSLDAILKQALDLILSIPWLSFESRGGIFLVEGDPHKLIMKAQRGLSDQIQEECAVVPFGKCLCGRAAARGEAQFSDAVDERHEIRYEGMAPHGHYCVPIMNGKIVLGVINMYLKAGHRRDEKELEFLSAMASALAGIIQRKRAEEEREMLIIDLRNVLDVVSRSQKEWQDTFDSITDMISIVSKDFTILKANKAFSAYYGFKPEDVLNKKCYELVHNGDAPIPNCPHLTTIADNKSSGDEMYDQRTGRTFSIFTFPYHSPEGEAIGSIHVMRDVTDDKEKEMRLITSERLAALGQMASGIAHEINNPLASIAGCSEGLLSRVRKGQCETALFESYLSIIQEEVFRCKSITTAMLSFVRKTTYEKKEINLAESLDKTIEIIGFQGRLKDIEVVRKYQDPMPLIHGNEGELRQVILAVVTNALDAMQDRGTLTIETGVREDGVAIRISDTGNGIPPEIINRIFDPFFTTKSERGGTGLGLSIARKIAGNHNGKIEVTSTTGKGTTFTVVLPMH